MAAFIAQHTGAKGPAYTISTACSSAGKALAAAAGLLQAGICDAVIAGGGDALCRFALEGFHALQLIADKPCEPFSLCGGGINHGEGAALFLLTYREAHADDIVLSGYGETADLHASSKAGKVILDTTPLGKYLNNNHLPGIRVIRINK